jgi:hypothetical protein
MIMNDPNDEELIYPSGGALPMFTGVTAEEAKAYVTKHIQDGISCPTCGQFCKVYKRKLNSTMALALVLIYQFFKTHPHAEWLHIAAFLVKVKHDSSIAGGDAVKLRYWGLIERAHGERDDGSDRVGRYRITDIGKQFVEGKIAVPRYVYLYNQLLLRLSEEMTTMREALGDKFKYDELMKTTT